ncbi:hypothetical protein HNQ91_001143 [Filimonas zeae]|uniref:Uncharacterized protein n=1 Tax=Filimonas zeae TaxID=1737353 RepID=A0A917IS66_9BACT|nr:hypothetical protein [Filimonas zeae]MDR6338121.1 hypothetical protein [Filimonas zeae]GGH61826.1 hypothetical protein GCM10011379_11180 [Filimonas zeae]
MAVDIADTIARVRLTEYNYSVDIVRLAGNEENVCVRLLDDEQGSVTFIDLMPGAYGTSWQLQCYMPKRTLYKGSLLELYLDNNILLEKTFITGGARIGKLWLSIVGLSDDEVALLSKTGIKQVVVKDDARQFYRRFTFSNQPQQHYETAAQGAELLKTAVRKVVEESRKQAANPQPRFAPELLPVVFPTVNVAPAVSFSYPDAVTEDQPLLNGKGNTRLQSGLIVVLLVVLIFIIIVLVKGRVWL